MMKNEGSPSWYLTSQIDQSTQNYLHRRAWTPIEASVLLSLQKVIEEPGGDEALEKIAIQINLNIGDNLVDQPSGD